LFAPSPARPPPPSLSALLLLLLLLGVTSTHLSAPCQNVLSVISFSFSLLMLLEGGGKGRKLF
jgi:hypothetical protein